MRNFPLSSLENQRSKRAELAQCERQLYVVFILHRAVSLTVNAAGWDTTTQVVCVRLAGQRTVRDQHIGFYGEQGEMARGAREAAADSGLATLGHMGDRNLRKNLPQVFYGDFNMVLRPEDADGAGRRSVERFQAFTYGMLLY